MQEEPDKKKKEILIKLGPERLADALLELAFHYKAADELVNRLTATPDELIKKFKSKLAGLKRSKRYIPYRESGNFALELSSMLKGLKEAVTDPDVGLKLAIAFFQADKGTLGRCDDSSGMIGDVYRIEARDLFLHYASKSTKKKAVAAAILKAVREDDYGVRDALIRVAGKCLPESNIRNMVEELDRLANAEEEQFQRVHLKNLIRSLAKQIKDAWLFEQTVKTTWEGEMARGLSTADHVEIAKVYLESGDVPAAEGWLNKIQANESFMDYERAKLWQEIYIQKGERDNLADLLFKNFRSHHSVENLEKLLEIIGQERRDQILNDEAAFIHNGDELKYTDVDFLIAIGKVREAETYLLKRADQLDGFHYPSLLGLIKFFEKENRSLMTTLLYRALLLHVLEKANTKAYSHGVRYLKKLDKLENSIVDWRQFPDHKVFKEEILKKHGRKTSFWSRYQG